jgi:predicted nucleotidyltransferase
MALTQTEVISRLQRFIARVSKHVPVRSVYLFGSYADGRAGDDSDIDVAVISPAFGKDRHRDLTLLSRCRMPDALEIEALPFAEQELQELPPGSLLREIIRHGRLVQSDA